MVLALTPLGWKVLKWGTACLGFCTSEYLAYYKLLPFLIKKNFSETPLEDKPEYSEPVLIVQEDIKFVFNHKGGSQAADSLLVDTFSNNKLFRRALALQCLSFVSLAAGVAKQKPKITAAGLSMVLGNMLYSYPLVASGFRCLWLSQEVKLGNLEIWENLNEARYVQRMQEFFAPAFKYPRYLGISMVSVPVLYCTPFLSCLCYISIYSLGWHKKYN